MSSQTSNSQDELSHEEYERYSRQIIINEIQAQGQSRLKNARVICVGAGGLNSSTLLYLAACGVGSIGIIDNDIVTISNLQRQILYQYSDIGKKKARKVDEKLTSLNPSINIYRYITKLTEKNIENILSEYEIIIDGTDNFKTRYLISQYCYKLHKIHIYGAIDKFTGQVSIFNYRSSTSYYKLYDKISYSKIRACSETGVVNTLAGIIGLLQATEAIKIITGVGEVSRNYLSIFNLINCSLNRKKIQSKKITSQQINTIKQRSLCANAQYISINKIRNSDKLYKLIDVRTALEFQLNAMDNAINIPLSILQKNKSIERIKNLQDRHEIAIYCNNSTRSHLASKILNKSLISHYVLSSLDLTRKERDSNPR